MRRKRADAVLTLNQKRRFPFAQIHAVLFRPLGEFDRIGRNEIDLCLAPPGNPVKASRFCLPWRSIFSICMPTPGRFGTLIEK